MLCPAFSTCKICGKSFKSNAAFGQHLSKYHGITYTQYIGSYLEKCLCRFCGIRSVGVSSRPLQQYALYGTFYKNTCGDPSCDTLFKKEYQGKLLLKHGDEIRERARKIRVAYLEKRLGKTAWEKRNKGQLSYLERWFYTDVIVKNELESKYDIVCEHSVYPYFIDFAFLDIKVAVELDGKQHFRSKERIDHDRKKDAALSEAGWSVFRIRYDEINVATEEEFLSFLGKKVSVGRSFTSNRVYKSRDIEVIRAKYDGADNPARRAKCPICGSNMSNAAKICFSCRVNTVLRKNKPTKEELIDMLKTDPVLRIIEKLNTSYKTVKRWCASYNIDYMALRKNKVSRSLTG